MNSLYTKSSAIAKLTDEDIKIFSRVLEKAINDFTDRNTEWTDDFQLSEEQVPVYTPKKLRSLGDLTPKLFAKLAIADKCQVSFEQIKSKIFVKCYHGEKLVLEIAMSLAQMEAIEDKYDVDFDQADVKYQLYFAGTFMRKHEDGPLSSKLSDLRLFKITKTGVIKKR